MSGKADFSGGEASHDSALREGISTIFSWTTILPVHGARVFDRLTGSRAMRAFPLVGIVMGILSSFVACILITPRTSGTASSFFAAVCIVGLWAACTRCMHLDGLADSADALGSYAPPQRAQEILADPRVGTFGLVAVLFCVLIDVSSLCVLFSHAHSLGLPATGVLVAYAPIIGRIGGLSACRGGFSPTSSHGFGALIIGTIPPWCVVAWSAGIYIITAGALCVLSISLVLIAFMMLCLGLLSSYAWTSIFFRRCGGLNGDCVGACVEVATCVSLASMACMVGWLI